MRGQNTRVLVLNCIPSSPFERLFASCVYIRIHIRTRVALRSLCTCADLNVIERIHICIARVCVSRVHSYILVFIYTRVVEYKEPLQEQKQQRRHDDDGNGE